MSSDTMSADDKIEILSSRIAKLEALYRQSLHQPFGVYMGDGLVLTQTTDGLRFFVPASDTIMAPKLIGNRVWEPRVTEFVRKNIRPGTFLDVGANVGYFSVLVAMLLAGGKGRVHSFEPNPRIANLLRRNVSINWSLAPITVHECALGGSDERLTLTIPNQIPANATLLSKGIAVSDSEQIEVEVKPLSSLDIDFSDVSMMKIDVEGAEPAVLAGAENVLRNNDIDIVMEWDLAAQRYVGGASERAIALIRDLGYRCYLIDREVSEVEDLSKCGYSNIFLTRRALL